MNIKYYIYYIFYTVKTTCWKIKDCLSHVEVPCADLWYMFGIPGQGWHHDTIEQKEDNKKDGNMHERLVYYSWLSCVLGQLGRRNSGFISHDLIP